MRTAYTKREPRPGYLALLYALFSTTAEDVSAFSTPPSSTPLRGHKRRLCSCASSVETQPEMVGSVMPVRGAPQPQSLRKRTGAGDFRGTLEDSRETQKKLMNAATPSQLLSCVIDNAAKSNHVNVCTALHRLGKICGNNGGIAALSEPEKAQLNALLVATQGLLKEGRFTARHLCNLAWAFARLNIPSNHPLLSDVAAHLLQRLHRSSPGELTMALWAYATLGARPVELFTAAAVELRLRSSELSMKEIAMVSWALAVSGHFDLLLMDALANEAERWGGLGAIHPQDLGTLAWSFGRMCTIHWQIKARTIALMDKMIVPQSLASMDRFSCADLTQVLLSMAWCAYDSEPLLEALCARAENQLIALLPKELATILWSLAKLDYTSQSMLGPLCNRVAAVVKKDGFNGQELSNIAWAIAVLDLRWAGFLKTVLKSLETKDLLDEERRQLHQVWMACHRTMPQAFQGVDESLLARSAQCWHREKGRMKKSSARHLGVSKYLTLMGIAHHNESKHDIDIEVVGVGLVSEGKDGEKRECIRLKVALEVDGPAHFTCNTLRPLGHTKLKHRILKQMGWDVIQVPYYTWDRIPFWASMEKKRYLQRTLGIQKTIFFGERDWSTYSPIGGGAKSTRFD